MRIVHPTRTLISAAHHIFLHFSPRKPPVSLCYYSVRLNPCPGPRLRVRVQKTSAVSNMSTISSEDDAKFGFSRGEMYKANLAGTVDSYDRHVFLSYKGPDSWLPRVEESEVDPLPKLLSSAIKARKNDITVKTKVTICGGGEGSDGDVLIFLEMIKYKGLKDEDVESFVDDVLVNGKPWTSGVQETLTGSYVFVCAHGSRDKRCGVCGPALIEKLNEEIESRGLKGQIFVSPCSHIGGHKYAGNLIIYSPDSEGKIMGHWYGYVTPDDVPSMLDQHIAKGEIIERLWRGQMGASKEEGQKVEEQKLPNSKDGKKSKKHDSNSQVKEIVGGCCQGANGSSCCREGGVDEKGAQTKAPSKFSSWIESLEQRDVLTAAAVVGAVATVAIAYSAYRRSG
ncbi:altered inheritance of mitochondria protein 32 [Mangifera indica]|uniref:altered inheritance of mitochondria protein 32 n=1 Tax=Mangifera indica TaxID=29780 RepID=UPI001CFB2C2D|nr:altered inheritance of mitochondria protein 32 [Mangifera indica]